MMEGTDLFAAYQSFQDAPAAAVPSPPVKEQQPTFNKELFNQQYEQEQRIVKAIHELKKQKESFNQTVQQAQQQQQAVEGTSYLDKLATKKKELARMLQYALIIALGLSIHFLIDEYIKYYITNNDVSIERQVIIKLLYPISLVFIIWNLKAFVR